MKQYYIHNGTEQQGPFTYEELKSKNIKSDTPIWFDGLEDWTTAERVQDLASLFTIKEVTPLKEPVVHVQQSPKTPIKPNRKVLKIIIASIIFIALSVFCWILIEENKRPSAEEIYAREMAKADSVAAVAAQELMEAEQEKGKIKLGDEMDGGIIFYINKDGLHGLVVSKEKKQFDVWPLALKKARNYRDGTWRLPTLKELRLLYKAKEELPWLVKEHLWTSELDINWNLPDSFAITKNLKNGYEGDSYNAVWNSNPKHYVFIKNF